MIFIFIYLFIYIFLKSEIDCVNMVKNVQAHAFYMSSNTKSLIIKDKNRNYFASFMSTSSLINQII